MTKKQYLRKISAALRRSGMEKKTRKRLEADLASDFSIRLEKGESAEEIIRSMGTPEELVKGFCLEAPAVSPKTRKQKVLFVLGIIFAVLTAAAGLGTAWEEYAVGNFPSLFYGRPIPKQVNGAQVIGGADGPTKIFVSSNPSPALLALLGICAAVCVVCFVLYARSSRKKQR